MRTLFLIVAILAAGIVYGQTSPQITVSTEKVNVNGEVMYVHKVKAKETLYSIAKAYNVTIDDIVRKNEVLKAGLKEGSIIYIPSKGTAVASTPLLAVEEVNKPAQEIKQPLPAEKTEQAVQENQNWELSKENIKRYSKKKHTVKWYETLEDIAAKYKVSQEDIVAFNNLKSYQVTKKQVLYIPNADFIALIASKKEQEPAITSEDIPDEKDAVKTDEQPVEYADWSFSKENELTYILPLALNDTLGPNSNFMDFYAGSLLAINKFKKNGLEYKVNIIDQLQFSSVDEIVASGKLDGKRFIIGPVRFSDIKKTLELTAGKSIVISPMDQLAENLLEGHPALFQIPPTNKAQQESILKLFANKCTANSNPVIIYEKGTRDTLLIRMAIDTLSARGIECTTFSYGLLEGREILGSMLAQMKPECNNLVFVPSNSEAFVSDVVRNLNLIHTNPLEENRRNITLFGLPKWRNFEGIEVDYFHRMNLHLSLPYFVDYNTEEVKDFLMKYRALFNNEPTPFAFQGYDITLATYGFEGNNNATSGASGSFLQLNFNFKRTSEGNGLSNTGTTDIAYNPDYTITVIK